MTDLDLMQTWIPAVMIAVLLGFIVLDSWWQSRRNAREAERGGGGSGGGGGGGASEAEAKWHEDNKAAYAERAWHEKNRQILRNRQGKEAQPVGAAPAPGGGASVARSGGYWGPWLVLTSLILGAGAVFYIVYPLTQ